MGPGVQDSYLLAPLSNPGEKMNFDPFLNKVQFEPFIVPSSTPCSRCGSKQILIAPTNNTHAASARCPGIDLGSDSGLACKKFYRWLGKTELQALLAQHRDSQKAAQ
jgi:hypothetical protein